LARQHSDTAVNTLVHIAENGKQESARVAAASAPLDRGWNNRHRYRLCCLGDLSERFRHRYSLFRRGQRTARRNAISLKPGLS